MYHGRNAFTGLGWAGGEIQGTFTGPALWGLRQWATGPGHTSSGSSVNEDFETGSRRNLPTNPGQKTGAGLTGFLRAQAQNQPIGAHPAHQAPDFPNSLTPCLCFLASAGRWRGAVGPRVVWPGPFERVPSFLWFSWASPSTSASTLSSPLRENPTERMDFLSALWRSGFCGLQVAVLHQVSPFRFSPALRH